MVTERTFSALESRAKEGKSAGGKAYGYDGREINKAQAEVIKRIFKRYIAGAGVQGHRRRTRSPRRQLVDQGQ